MRSIWKGSIGFGLVNIPVSMYSATEESNLPFVTLDKSNNGRIRYKKVNETTGKEVKETDIIKGYKVGEHYVLMDEADFQKATPEKIDHLEIVQFVNEKDIDAVYFEKPYYLTPDKSGARAYALLRDALKKEGKAALGPLVYHKREWVCLIKPFGEHLMLHRLRFAEEIRGTETITVPATTVKPEELKMASSLISQLTKPFKPDAFKDEYAEKLLKVIEAKSKGKSAPVKHMKLVHSSTTEDLMQKLKASLKTSSRKAS
ncbi:MAG TPA: Ku protein [Flavisolibacter sp.]|jgi:DNA end-binding protein Ku|nr:Ku protein [Flavisolibacter sp.]